MLPPARISFGLEDPELEPGWANRELSVIDGQAGVAIRLWLRSQFPFSLLYLILFTNHAHHAITAGCDLLDCICRLVGVRLDFSGDRAMGPTQSGVNPQQHIS